MKSTFGWFGWAVALMVAPAVGCAVAADESASMGMDMDMDAMMQRFKDAGTPGKAHQALDPLVGEWTAEVKNWAVPDAPPTVTHGAAIWTWILNGRFVQQEYRGEMMGVPFTGMSLIGYDNQKQKYRSIWVDDMSTALFISTGTANEEGTIFTFSGAMDCALTGEKNIPVRHVLRILGPDQVLFEMHDSRRGEDSMSMEITYTRK